MSVLVNSLGRALLSGGGALLLGGAATAPVSGSLPSSIAGLASWWDAAGRPASGAAITSLADKMAVSPLTPNVAATWVGRLAGNFGGIGLEVTQQAGYPIQAWAPTLHPLLDPTLGLSSPVAFGAGGAATIDLVWTRPNLLQALVNSNANPQMSATFPGGTSTLMSIGGVAVLGMTNTGAGDGLIMWPNVSPTILTGTLTPRHTHAVRLCGSHAAGWDVFLDGTKLTASPVASQLGSVPTTASVAFLAGAQCWFHEATAYSRALTDAECSVLSGYLARWPLGVRQSAIMLPTGQSNMGYLGSATNGHRDLCRGIEYLTGLASFTLLQQATGAGQTVVGGHGLIGDDTNYLKAAITDDPTVAPLGATGPGTAMQSLVRSLPAYLQADVCGLFAYYSENDAGFAWPQRTAFAGMVRRFNSLARGFPQSGPTRDATNWLLAWNSDIPFSGGEGHASHKAAIASVVADPTQNAMLWLLNGTGGIQLGGTFNPATGVNSGGDGLHVDDVTDDVRHALFGAEPLARRLVAMGRGSTVIPAGIPSSGGSAVSSVVWEAGSVSGNAAKPTALITVRHDVGNDLRVPLLAATGLGWVLLDGGVPSGNVLRILGTSCVRLTPTTLRVGFASAPTNPLSAVTLFYIYNEDSLPRANNPGAPGRGNLVTDNYSDIVAVPAIPGFDIGTYLGAQYRVDRPLAAFPLGVPLG